MDGEQLFTKDNTGEFIEYTPPAPPEFKSTLPEEIRESEHLKDVTDGVQLARYYVDMKANQSLPPESVDGYQFEKPEGFELDESTFMDFKQIAFDNKLSPDQFSSIMKFEAQRNETIRTEIENSIKEHQAETEKTLKAEWGDKYDEKLDSARRFLNHESIADDDFKKFLEETRFGDNLNVIRYFAKLADLISEDGFIKPGTGGKTGPMIGEDGRPMLSFPSMQTGDK